MHSEVVSATLLQLEVNLPVGEGAANIIGFIGIQYPESRDVVGIGAHHQGNALLVVGKGVAHVHYQCVGDACLDVDTRRNQVVVGTVLVLTHVIGACADVPADVVGVELPGINRTPVAGIVVGIDDGPQVTRAGVTEVVIVGSLVCHAGQDGIGNGLGASLAVTVNRGDDVVVALHLVGQCLAELTLGQPLGNQHVARHAHDSVGHVVKVAVIHTACRGIPRQVAHAVLNGQHGIGDGQRGVVAGKDVQAIDGRETGSVAEEHIHIVVGIAYLLVEGLGAAGGYGDIVSDGLTVEPHAHRHVPGERTAVVGSRGNGKGYRAGGTASVKGEGQVVRGSGCHRGGSIVLEEHG